MKNVFRKFEAHEFYMMNLNLELEVIYLLSLHHKKKLWMRNINREIMVKSFTACNQMQLAPSPISSATTMTNDATKSCLLNVLWSRRIKTDGFQIPRYLIKSCWTSTIGKDAVPSRRPLVPSTARTLFGGQQSLHWVVWWFQWASAGTLGVGL